MAGLLERARDLAKDLGGKARTAVNENQDRIGGGIDKAAHFVDDKTKGRYAERIGKAQDAVHKAVGKLGGQVEKKKS